MATPLVQNKISLQRKM